MRKVLAWLGVATLFVSASLASSAHADDSLKPYVTLILDTSGSMVATSSNNPTGSGPPSCGGIDTKLDHAKCAINNIVNSYGDMVFSLGRFRSTMGGTTTSGTFPSGCCLAGPGISANNGCAAGPSCSSTASASGSNLQVLTGLVDGGNQAAATFTNFTASSCTVNGTDPEIWDAVNGCPGANGADGTCGGATPLDGVLTGIKRYWQGQQATDGTVLWPGNQAGFDPIRNDPLKTVFIPPAGKTTCNPNPTTCSTAQNCTTNCCCVQQCRPYVAILLTDGAETCGGDPADRAAELLDTVVDNRRYRIETKVIGFGIAPGNQQIEDIAHSGGAPDLVGTRATTRATRPTSNSRSRRSSPTRFAPRSATASTTTAIPRSTRTFRTRAAPVTTARPATAIRQARSCARRTARASRAPRNPSRPATKARCATRWTTTATASSTRA